MYTMKDILTIVHKSGIESAIVTIVFELEQLGLDSLAESIFIEDYELHSDLTRTLVQTKQQCSEEEFSMNDYHYAQSLLDFHYQLEILSKYCGGSIRLNGASNL